MMNQTIPQNAMSAMSFVDGANESQLRAMVAAKNPFSVFALSRLQSIRDAKMKAQAGQPEPPPLSQEIPQQLDQLSRPQQPQQPMQQQPPMGLASIGGAPTGAGGGMVAFKDGGGIHHFFVGGDKDLPKEESFPAWFGKSIVGRDEEHNLGYIPYSIGKNINEITRSVYGKENPDFYSETQPATIQPTPVPQASTGTSTNPGRSTVEGAPVGIATVAPNQAAPSQGGDSSGLGGLGSQMMKGYNETKKSLTPLYADQQKEQQNAVDVMQEQQKNIDAANAPAKFAEAQGTPEQRDAMRNERQLKLESAMPDPYANTAKRLDTLSKQLEGDKAGSSNKALLMMATKLMSTKSPHFMTALGESGTAGIEEYNRINEANQKREMALMNAQTSLSAAQDARKRGLYDKADSQMKDYYASKKDAFVYGSDAAKAKAQGAIAIAGAKANLPVAKIQQVKDLHSLSEDLFKNEIELKKVGIEGAKVGMMGMPETGKVLMFAQRNPWAIPYLQDEQKRGDIFKAYSLLQKENPGTDPDELIKQATRAVAGVPQMMMHPSMGKK